MNATARTVLQALADEGPLTLAGIVEVTGIGPDEARHALRYLTSLYLVEAFWRPAAKRRRPAAYYRATAQGLRELGRPGNP